MSQGSCSQTSDSNAVSQAIWAVVAMTTVWNEHWVLAPLYNTNSLGSRITQALTAGFLTTSPYPAAGGRGRSKIRKAAPQKVAVKSPFKISHVRLELEVPEL